MSDFEKWALGAVGLLLTAVLGLFGKEKLASVRGARKFAEAGESQQVDVVVHYKQIAQDAITREAGHLAKIEELTKLLAEAQKRLELVSWVSKNDPKEPASIAQDSALPDLDRPLRPTPQRRRTDPGHDPFQAANPYSPARKP